VIYPPVNGSSVDHRVFKELLPFKKGIRSDRPPMKKALASADGFAARSPMSSTIIASWRKMRFACNQQSVDNIHAW
jgi:hypothetical protein